MYKDSHCVGMEKVQFLYDHHVSNDNIWSSTLFAELKMQYLHFHMSLSNVHL